MDTDSESWNTDRYKRSLKKKYLQKQEWDKDSSSLNWEGKEFSGLTKNTDTASFSQEENTPLFTYVPELLF